MCMLVNPLSNEWCWWLPALVLKTVGHWSTTHTHMKSRCVETRPWLSRLCKISSFGGEVLDPLAFVLAWSQKAWQAGSGGSVLSAAVCPGAGLKLGRSVPESGLCSACPAPVLQCRTWVGPDLLARESPGVPLETLLELLLPCQWIPLSLSK